jgi:tetratricopeptide (TPR) repeat protein
MPSHIDIRLGHYDEAILANQKGVSVDSTWASQGGFYTLYRAHNFHFLAYAAMFEGRRELAVKAARDMVQQIPLEVVREYIDFLDGFMAVPFHVLVRFGMWDDMIREPKPPTDLVVTLAFWHYGRTVAYAALGRVKEASAEFDSLKRTYDFTPESRLIGNNATRTVLQIGLALAEGELAYRRGNYKRAFTLLREAVKRDDALRYDEPWGWMMPARHSLGALLLERGQIAEAEAVYREDLRLHPQNGWALKGLAECLHRSGRHQEAAQTDSLFAKSWARADTEIKASCYCRVEAWRDL